MAAVAMRAHPRRHGPRCGPSLFTVPAFALLALGGARIFAPFGLPQEIGRLALTYWFPRMLGGPLGVAALGGTWDFSTALAVRPLRCASSSCVAVINALLNQLFMFNFGMGVAGSAWATNAAQLVGVAVALIWFLSAGDAQRAFDRT